MSIQYPLPRQIQAFHAAILDDCDRAARPEQPDAMVLRLRINALALAKVQLAMVALMKASPRNVSPQPSNARMRDLTRDRDRTSGSWP